MAAFCFFGFVQILYESLWIIIGGICRLLPLSSNLACSKIHHVLSICCCCCCRCCCCCWCAFSAMFDCQRVRHRNSHGYTGCRRHGVNPAVQPSRMTHQKCVPTNYRRFMALGKHQVTTRHSSAGPQLWLRSQGQRTRNPGQEQPQHLHQRPWKLECSTFENYWLLLDPFKELDKCMLYLYHIYIYVYGDRSKGPCKDFKLRKPCMLCWKPSRKFFFEFAKLTFFFIRGVVGQHGPRER